MTSPLPPAKRQRFPARSPPPIPTTWPRAAALLAGRLGRHDRSRQRDRILRGRTAGADRAGRVAAGADRARRPAHRARGRNPRRPSGICRNVSLYRTLRSQAGDVLLYAGMFSFVEFEEQRGPFQPESAQIVHLCSDPAQIGNTVRRRRGARGERGARTARSLHGDRSGNEPGARHAQGRAALAAHRKATDAHRAKRCGALRRDADSSASTKRSARRNAAAGRFVLN